WGDDLAVLAEGEVTVADAGSGQVLTGLLDSVPWPRSARTLVVPVRRDGELFVATVATDALGLPSDGANTAGEPVVRGVQIDGVPVTDLAPTGLTFDVSVAALQDRRALARA